ncbi:MAG: ABC transporter permease [Deltaproteobacteria bacterium]|nr:ABC transporter permease [Deltaproteobacteria bacterium]
MPLPLAINKPLELTFTADDTVALQGDLDATVPAKVWDKLLKRPASASSASIAPSKSLTLDLSGLTVLDLNGAAQLLWLKSIFEKKEMTVSIKDVPENFSPIWDLACRTLAPRAPLPSKDTLIETVGHHFSDFFKDMTALIAFLGEVIANFILLIPHPLKVRWKTTLAITEKAVVNALPVTALVAFLVGLILAFQAAMFMKLFGVDIFVADLVGLSIIRELGTLLTAIVLTGRSGSAFSAELGAMKINQEIDAFLTMGLSPTRDLALPRVIALTLATPLLTILADFAGLLGGNVVMITRGYPVSVFWTELSGHLSTSDLGTGLFKSLVFGFTVAAIGCQRGLATGSGPGAVGEATTKGVVTNIVVLATLDSVFAVLFYVLNW